MRIYINAYMYVYTFICISIGLYVRLSDYISTYLYAYSLYICHSVYPYSLITLESSQRNNIEIVFAFNSTFFFARNLTFLIGIESLLTF